MAEGLPIIEPSLQTTMPGEGAVRGFWQLRDGVAYGVKGATFSEALPEAEWVIRGTLATTSGPVRLTPIADGVQLVDQQETYTYTTSTQVFATVPQAGVLLDWRYIPAPPLATGFEVWRALETGEQRQLLGIVTPVDTRPARYSYRDRAVTPGQTYRWEIVALSDAQQSTPVVTPALTIPYPVVAPLDVNATYQA